MSDTYQVASGMSATAAGWTGRNDPSSQFDLERARKGGLTTAAIALFVPQGTRDASLAAAQQAFTRRDAAIHTIADADPKLAGFARSPADVRRIVASGRIAIVESLLNSWPLGDRMGENGGLSPLGRQAVGRLNDLGVLIDVRQLSDATFDQVVALSRAPVIATHSDVRALVDTGRNLSDSQLDALKSNSGVIGINAFSAYLRAGRPQTMQAISALQAAYGLSPTGGAALPPARQTEYDRRFHEIVGRNPRRRSKI